MKNTKKAAKRALAIHKELLCNIHNARYELECATQNFAYATEPELVDMYSYQIKACQTKYQYLLSRAKEIGLTANTARTVEVLNELADGSKIASVCITFENQQEVNGSFVMIEDRTIQVLGMRIR